VPEQRPVAAQALYDAAEMYGDNYGYRSGLNQSMVNHLTDKVRISSGWRR
jgi:hypothetical protein